MPKDAQRGIGRNFDSNHNLIASVSNVVWPISVQVMPFHSISSGARDHLMVALCANGFVFVNYIRSRRELPADYANEEAEENSDAEDIQWNVEICTYLRCIVSLYGDELRLASDEESITSDEPLITSRSHASLHNHQLSVFAITTAITDYSRRTQKSLIVKRWLVQLVDELNDESAQLHLRPHVSHDTVATNYDFINHSSGSLYRQLTSSLSSGLVVLAFGHK
jgi:hypothetical protein